jgi:2'-5' RNA ligase
LDRSQEGIRWSAPEQWHITIQFFEDVDIQQLKWLFLSIRARGVVATMGPRVTRLGQEVLVVPVDGLLPLVENVQATMSSQTSSKQLPYIGHVTLGRTKKNLTPRLEGKSVEGSFQVDRLLLIESQVTRDGHKHSIVESQMLL